MKDQNTTLPRTDDRADRRNELKATARRRMHQDGNGLPLPAPVYGAPVVPIRTWTARGVIAAITAFVLGTITWVLSGGRPIMPMPVPVYGAPPPALFSPAPPGPSARGAPPRDPARLPPR